jgi:hypothetical protein
MGSRGKQRADADAGADACAHAAASGWLLDAGSIRLDRRGDMCQWRLDTGQHHTSSGSGAHTYIYSHPHADSNMLDA